MVQVLQAGGSSQEDIEGRLKSLRGMLAATGDALDDNGHERKNDKEGDRKEEKYALCPCDLFCVRRQRCCREV
jgi:hypothetical protein